MTYFKDNIEFYDLRNVNDSKEGRLLQIFLPLYKTI